MGQIAHTRKLCPCAINYHGEFKKLKAYKKDDSLVETNIYVLAKGGV